MARAWPLARGDAGFRGLVAVAENADQTPSRGLIPSVGSFFVQLAATGAHVIATALPRGRGLAPQARRRRDD